MWMISIIALWVLVLFETVLLVLLLRALGEMRQQGRLSAGSSQRQSELNVGEQAPSFTANAYGNESIRLENVRGRKSVLAFVSPGCSACAGAIEALNTLQGEDHNLALLVIGDADEQKNHAFALEHQAQMPILAANASLALDVYRIRGFPFVYLLDEQQIIRAKGTVNNYEHLQALMTVAFGQPLSQSNVS